MNLIDFQDVITTVLLYFPHSLTSITHEKKKLFWCLSVNPSIRFFPKKNHWCYPPTVHPSPIPPLHCDPHMAWHKFTDTRRRKRRALESEVMREKRQPLTWQPKNRDDLFVSITRPSSLQAGIHVTAACDWSGGCLRELMAFGVLIKISPRNNPVNVYVWGWKIGIAITMVIKGNDKWNIYWGIVLHYPFLIQIFPHVNITPIISL